MSMPRKRFARRKVRFSLFLQLLLLQNSQWKERVLLRSFSQNFFHTTSYNMFWVSKTKTHGKMTDDFLFWGLPYPNCSEIPIIFWWSLVTYCLQTLVLTFRWIRDVCFTITKTAYLTTWQPVHRNPPISPASWGLPKSLDAVTWIPWDEIWDMRLTDRL